MTIWNVHKSYDSHDYQIVPYNLVGVIEWWTIPNFIKHCRLTLKSANRLKKRLENIDDN